MSFSTKLYKFIEVSACLNHCLSDLSLLQGLLGWSGLTDLLKWSFLLREEVVFHNLSCCLSMDLEFRSVPDTD